MVTETQVPTTGAWHRPGDTPAHQHGTGGCPASCPWDTCVGSGRQPGQQSSARGATWHPAAPVATPAGRIGPCMLIPSYRLHRDFGQVLGSSPQVLWVPRDLPSRLQQTAVCSRLWALGYWGKHAQYIPWLHQAPVPGTVSLLPGSAPPPPADHHHLPASPCPAAWPPSTFHCGCSGHSQHQTGPFPPHS